MIFKAAHYTDIGPVRSTNQDSYTIKIAGTDYGPVAMAVVCDGMGGLSQGELASAHVIRGFDNWFWNYLPQLLADGLNPENLSSQWNGIVQDANRALQAYGRSAGLSLGTTVLALLTVNDQYYLLHVGDCRAFLMKGGSEAQLTCDQTLAMREYKAGRLSAQQLNTDPRQHVLLQCVGGNEVVPEFFTGACPENSMFLLCSDGFYHALDTSQREALSRECENTAALDQMLKDISAVCRDRGETDNITAVCLQCLESGCAPTVMMNNAAPQPTLRLSVQEDITCLHTDKTL